MQGLVCYGEDLGFHPKGDGSLEGCEQRVAMCMLGSLLWLLGGFGGAFGEAGCFSFQHLWHSVDFGIFLGSQDWRHAILHL